MFKQILVGIDAYSEPQHAFDDALVIAQATGASLKLIHVFSLDDAYELCQLELYSERFHKLECDPMHPDRLDPIVECILAKSLGREAKIPEVLGVCHGYAQNAGVRAEIQTAHGKPGHLLCNEARDGKADLIVVGHRDKHWSTGLGLYGLELGSISHYVIHHAPCSVLVTYRHVEDQAIIGRLEDMKQILVAIDGLTTSQFVLQEALDLAKATKANLTLLNVLLPHQSDRPLELTELYPDQANAGDVSIAIKQIHADNNHSIGSAICKFAETEKFNLILVGRHKRSELQELVLGSVSHHVVNHATCAVLIVHSFPCS